MNYYVLGALFLLLFLSVCLRGVGKNQVYVLERFGRFYKELKPGIHFVIPIMDRVIKKVYLGEQKIRIKKDIGYINVTYKVIDVKKYAYAAKHPLKEFKKLSQTYFNLERLNKESEFLGIIVYKLS